MVQQISTQKCKGTKNAGTVKTFIQYAHKSLFKLSSKTVKGFESDI